MELHQNLAARPTWAEPGPLPFAEGRRTSPLQQPFPTSLTIPSLAEPDPMALISGLLPPSRENWQLLTWLWQFFPLVTLLQWVTDWYPQGKTSIESRWNIPGKVAWLTMEAPGFLSLLYIMNTLPDELGIEKLPKANWLMVSLFTVHYVYRAIISPAFLNPTMSPIHPLVWAAALTFQLINCNCIGGWLAGYGPTTDSDWAGRMIYIQLGGMLFTAGLLGNIFHEDILRDIRREKSENKGDGKKMDKVYRIPEGGFFDYALYAHYTCEWVEWLGFWMIGGRGFLPGQNFLLNEIATMGPRALSGKRWYLKTFGKDKIGDRKAVIPGLI